jgi:Flp pilus assembly protein TadD
MTISPERMREILAAEPSHAEEMLSDFLAADTCQLDDLAHLGASLAPRGLYGLAEKVFAKWASVTPNNPEPWTNLGLCLCRQKKMHDARRALEHALALDPDYLPAMNNLGEVYQELGEHDLQLKNCLRAVSKHPNSALAFNNLGSAFVEMGMFDEARHAFETCLILDPSSFVARFNLAKEASQSGQNQIAIQHLENLKVSKIAKNTREADILDLQLGIEYLVCGRLKEGWELYEKGFSPAIPASLARGPQRKFSVPMWNGKTLLPGERLMIWREQGIGDEIRFAALIPLLPKAIKRSLILECDHRLVDLFARSLPDSLVRSESDSVDDFAYHLPIGSLPRLLMTSQEVLRNAPPLIDPDPEEVRKFASRLEAFKGKKLIGICWRSHKLSATRNKKYTALQDWGDILAIPGTVFVSLQYGECEEEILEMEKTLGIQILRWNDVDLMNDLNGVAALMRNLDLVISVSAAVVPLAGAVGTPTICMCHRNWVLLGSKDFYPWFPSVVASVVPQSQAVATALLHAGKQVLQLAGAGGPRS